MAYEISHALHEHGVAFDAFMLVGDANMATLSPQPLSEPVTHITPDRLYTFTHLAAERHRTGERQDTPTSRSPNGLIRHSPSLLVALLQDDGYEQDAFTIEVGPASLALSAMLLTDGRRTLPAISGLLKPPRFWVTYGGVFDTLTPKRAGWLGRKDEKGKLIAYAGNALSLAGAAIADLAKSGLDQHLVSR